MGWLILDGEPGRTFRVQVDGEHDGSFAVTQFGRPAHSAIRIGRGPVKRVKENGHVDR